MSGKAKIQAPAPARSTRTPAQSAFQTRPFVVQAKSDDESSNEHEQSGLERYLQRRSARLSYHSGAMVQRKLALGGDQYEQEADRGAKELVQRQEEVNNTGLPDNLKTGIESLSGISMDDVKVHYNSSKPSQLQALAYAQGSDIHVGPGQQKHLAHEAWHVAQQKQGRVKPTLQTQGVAINDDQGLEREADVMGTKALQMRHDPVQAKMKLISGERGGTEPSPDSLIQRKALVNAGHMDSGGSWTPTLDGSGRVTKIVAEDLKLASGKSLPGSGHNSPTKAAAPNSWSWLGTNNLVHPKPPSYVRMHMLNGLLGGPGNDAENLAPGTASLNSHHEKHFESEAKSWLTRGGEIDKYVVEVTYQPASTTLTTAAGKQAWQDTIQEISGEFEYPAQGVAGTLKSNFQANEDPALDANPNWIGH